jgi:hypothetical protein
MKFRIVKYDDYYIAPIFIVERRFLLFFWKQIGTFNDIYSAENYVFKQNVTPCPLVVRTYE